jgi:hypothetical protein|tara:strand:- start:56 stop:451 length:396 start_codon:yes stop_codon:yes gene_type:complete
MIRISKEEQSKIRLLHEVNSVVKNNNKNLLKEEAGCGGPFSFSLGGGFTMDLQIEPEISFGGVDFSSGSYGCTLTYTFAFAPVDPQGGGGPISSPDEVFNKVIENGAGGRDAMTMKKDIEKRMAKKPRRNR